MITGCDGEGSFDRQHLISVSIAGSIGETGASGKMVSAAMVQRAGRADRGGLAG